jgi:hypothetical protein
MVREPIVPHRATPQREASRPAVGTAQIVVRAPSPEPPAMAVHIRRAAAERPATGANPGAVTSWPVLMRMAIPLERTPMATALSARRVEVAA